MNIYEISKEIEKISEMVDEDGVLLPEAEAALDDLQMEEKEKFKNIGWLLVNMKAEAAAYKDEAKRLSVKAKVLENKEARLKNWLKFVLESKKWNYAIKAWIFTFKLRAFKSVAITDEELLDDKYFRVKKDPNKTLIKQDITAWEDVEWAEIVSTNSVVVS